MKRLMKCSSLSLLTAPMMFASGCLINRTDVQNAVAAPIIDAISEVVAILLSQMLAGAGLAAA
jgi:hypothetical protein